MRKIIAIIAVLCLGLLIIPSISNEVKADTYNLIISLNNANCEDATLVSRGAIPSQNDTNYGSNAWLNVVNYLVEAPLDYENRSTVIKVQDNYLSNTTIFHSVFLELYAYDFPLTETNGVNISIYNLYSSFNESTVSWNNRTNDTTHYGPWEIPGGFHNSTSIDSIEVDTSLTGWYQLNITTIYREWVNNGSKNLGLIIRCTDAVSLNPNCRAVSFRSSEYTTASQRPRLNFTYTGGNNNPTGTSSIIKNQWNLKGFSGEIKNASTIYSEISNCTALSYKNETSGYWYTYWPEYGILENQNLEFGDGLFILTDLNTTWDHT